jgi:hypothetical protein
MYRYRHSIIEVVMFCTCFLKFTTYTGTGPAIAFYITRFIEKKERDPDTKSIKRQRSTEYRYVPVHRPRNTKITNNVRTGLGIYLGNTVRNISSRSFVNIFKKFGDGMRYWYMQYLMLILDQCCGSELIFFNFGSTNYFFRIRIRIRIRILRLIF